MATVSHSYDMKRPGYHLWGWLALVYLASYTAWLTLGPLNADEQFFVGNLAALFPIVVSACLSFWLGSHTALGDKGSKIRWAWKFMGIGLSLWAAGSLLIFLYGLVSTIPQFWSIALNSCYLAGYAAVTASLLVFPRPIRPISTPIRFYGDILISTAAILTFGWLAVLQPLSGSTYQSDVFHAVLFPGGDLLLLIVLMNIFMLTRLQENTHGQGWISLGLLFILTGDLARDYLFVNSLFQPANLTDLMRAAGFFAIAIAILDWLQQVQENGMPAHLSSGKNSVWRAVRQGLSSMGRAIVRSCQSTLPFLATFLLGGYALFGWSVNPQTDPLGLWMTLLLCLFLVARQGVLAGEREFQQYTMLVNSIAEPAFICDHKGRLKLVNPALLSSMGYSDIHALHNQPVACLTTPDSVPKNLLQTAFKTGWSGETSFLRMDGSTYPGYLSLRPIHHSAVEKLALAGTAHDLTLQKVQQEALQLAYDQVASAHHELETLNEQLEQKVEEKTGSLSEAYKILEQQNQTLQMLDELKSDFVSLVSHELRAPLTNISGGIELVLSGPQAVPIHARQSLTLVQSEIRRLTHFVETILDLSALDAGRMPLSSVPVALKDVNEKLDYQLKTMRGGERVHWNIPDGLPFISADEHALGSIVFHLIDNAIKYAPEGEITVSASRVNEANTEPGQVVVRIEDRGPGIPAEVLPLLFKKFYRLHHGDAQTVYGHGLGLYIVRRLLQAMGGDIRYDNRLEGGASFSFWLPVIEDKDENETLAG